MFEKAKLKIENSKLQQENTKITTENKTLRHEHEDMKLTFRHVKQLIDKTFNALYDLQEVDRCGNSEQTKIRMRNSIINELRLKNADIKKELDNLEKYI